METEKIGITEEVADFVTAVQYRDFSPGVITTAKRCIIDGIGVILAGSTETCTGIVREFARSVAGRKESSLLGKG